MNDYLDIEVKGAIQEEIEALMEEMGLTQDDFFPIEDCGGFDDLPF